MNTEERRLADMLHRVTPEPPRRVTVEDVAFRLANTAGRVRGDRSPGVRSPRTRRGFGTFGTSVRWSRGWAPVLAAASVFVVAGLSAGAAVLLTSHHNPAPQSGSVVNSGSATSSPPTSTSAAPTQAPTSTGPAKGPVPIPGGPWAAELLGHQTLVQGSLTGSGNSLYAYTAGYLVRMDPATGSILDQTPFSGAVANPPIVLGGTVWVVWSYGGGNVVLHGYDAATLAYVASVAVPAYGQVSSNAMGVLASGPDGRLYVAAGDTVAVVDPASGQVIRRIYLTSGPAGSLAVSPDGSELYVGTGAFRLLIYDLATGTETGLSSMNTGGNGGNLVATSGGVWGTMGVGMSEWVWFAPDGDLSFAQRVTPGAGAGLYALPSYDHGVVWIGGSHTVECLSPVTGQALASAPIPTDNGVVEYLGSVTVAAGHAYAYYQDDATQQTGVARMTPPAACGLTAQAPGS